MHIVVHDACNAGLTEYVANARATTNDGMSLRPNCLIIHTPKRGESSKVKIRLVGRPALYLQGLSPFVRPADPRIAEWSDGLSDPEVPAGYQLHYDGGEGYDQVPSGPPGPKSLFLRYRSFCLDRKDGGVYLKLFDFPASMMGYFKDWSDNFAENPGGKGGPDWSIKLERTCENRLRASVYFLERAPWTPEELCVFKSVANDSLWNTMKDALLSSVRKSTDYEILEAIVDAEEADPGERKVFSVSEHTGPCKVDDSNAEARVVQQVGRAVRPGPISVLCLYPEGLYCSSYDMRLLWVYQQGNDGINMSSYHYYDFTKKGCHAFGVDSWTARNLVRITDEAMVKGAHDKMRRDLFDQSSSVRRLAEAVRKAANGQQATALGSSSGADLQSQAPRGPESSARKPLTPEEYVGGFPVRTEITILPGDPPDRPKICPPYVEGSSESPRGEGF